MIGEIQKSNLFADFVVYFQNTKQLDTTLKHLSSKSLRLTFFLPQSLRIALRFLFLQNLL
jgi:hypothetical protein